MKNKYESQALAIAMVVLVVCSIIGMSIYSRVAKDKTLTIEEQASSEALEIADLLLDYIIQTPIETVVTIYNQRTPSNGESLVESKSEISSYFTSLGITNLSNLSFGTCKIKENDVNEYTLKVQEADESTAFEIRPGQVRSFITKGLTLSDTCSAQIKLNVRGENQTGFTISKIYSTTDGKIKQYETTDTESYCFSPGTGCYNKNFYGEAWIPYTVNQTKDLALVESVEYSGETYNLDEIRIKAVGGTVALTYNLDSECEVDGLRMIQVQAGANCNGVYRSKEILIPETKWSSTIFDYVIFNGQGSI